MSRSLNVYSVPFGALVSAAGSKDGGLLGALSTGGAYPYFDAAVEELVMVGTAPYQCPAADLGHALEALCRHLGRELDNEPVSATNLTYLEELDKHVAAAGLGVTLHDLTYGGGPITDLPWPDDFPSTGRWSPEQVQQAKAVYDEDPPTSDDPSADDVLATIGDWLTIAAARGDGLVGFYY